MFTEELAQATWYFVSSVKDKQYQVQTKTVSTADGKTLNLE
jgi:alkaline phosphatase D